jgi:hypothetical protein
MGRSPLDPAGRPASRRKGLISVKITVPDEVLKETAKCPIQFSCLINGAGEEDHRCRAQEILGEDLLFVAPADTAAFSCPYLVHYGDAHICRCPIRYHLYNRSLSAR